MDSLWLNSINKNYDFPSLSEDTKCDVCILGAGIFGLTCAYYLSKLGYRCCCVRKR